MSASDNGFVNYHFRHAIGGFFEFPTANAQKILPPFLQPIEPHHGQSVLSVMAFDFSDSMVGQYGELIMSVLVAPRLEKNRGIPRSAFYPFLLGTTTRASREHAIERWHLPHFMDDVDLSFTPDAHHIDIACSYKKAPIIEMRITDYEWEKVDHRYQAFTTDPNGAYMATIEMHAQFSENEEERGTVQFHEHEFTSALDLGEINTTPFRELWMREGLQTFHPLDQIARAGE
ncbi:MAG TPA: acetoacetate decarboxylase family protein [Gemmatimonadaceae bacterium]|nr:acetoacetate decarboxylase family protein [Gemmatimonadaceae bacterium]